MSRPYTDEEKHMIKIFQGFIKVGDRVRCIQCPGTARTFTFHCWDGTWMVSRSGKNDYSPLSIVSVNKVKLCNIPWV